jgi:hypothetical protein
MLIGAAPRLPGRHSFPGTPGRRFRVRAALTLQHAGQLAGGRGSDGRPGRKPASTAGPAACGVGARLPGQAPL